MVSEVPTTKRGLNAMLLSISLHVCSVVYLFVCFYLSSLLHSSSHQGCPVCFFAREKFTPSLPLTPVKFMAYINVPHLRVMHYSFFYSSLLIMS